MRCDCSRPAGMHLLRPADLSPAVKLRADRAGDPHAAGRPEEERGRMGGLVAGLLWAFFLFVPPSSSWRSSENDRGLHQARQHPPVVPGCTERHRAQLRALWKLWPAFRGRLSGRRSEHRRYLRREDRERTNMRSHWRAKASRAKRQTLGLGRTPIGRASRVLGPVAISLTRIAPRT